MTKYLMAFSDKKPQTWFAVGAVSELHARNLYKSFGVVVKKAGVLMLDYGNLDEPELIEEPEQKEPVQDEPELELVEEVEHEQVKSNGLSRFN